MQKGGRPMSRVILVIVVMAAAETAWALYVAVASVNLLLFYAVLIAASVVFFVPGVAQARVSAPEEHPSETPETKR
jgi:hypothetical protein